MKFFKLYTFLTLILLGLSTVAAAQRTIQGKVLDAEYQEPLVGVSVTITGTAQQTITDLNGYYKIEVNSNSSSLTFSFVGYEAQTVAIGNIATLNIKLKGAAALGLGENVVVVGSRTATPRSSIDRPVPIDVISLKELQQTGQPDLGQALHFTNPSLMSLKFGINETTPFADAVSLRGMGSDQVLLLINNKRRHKVSFLSINDGVSKGQVGHDFNVIPMLGLKRVEVLRDGAAVQYGSDAIAGVVNMELNNAASGGAVQVYAGGGYSRPQLDVNGVASPKTIQDGNTYNLSANMGFKLGKEGFLNGTFTYGHYSGYDRSGSFSASSGFYTSNKTRDDSLITANNINLDRAFLGAAKTTTYGIFLNVGIPISKNLNFYSFGGYTNKYVETNVFTRAPTNARRSVLSIFPHGYNPITPATLHDYMLTAGVKGTIGDAWNLDVSLGQGGNRANWLAKNTVNPSFGASSPTEFYVGSTVISQTLANLDLSKTFNKGNYPNLSLGVGSEVRYETFEQIAGDTASWKAGPLRQTKDVGSSGREGFSDQTAGKWTRTNVGFYAEVESDVTKDILLGAAMRFENYSDFGSDFSYKATTRIKILKELSVRGAISRGFRAPSMAQSYYSNYSNISFDNAGNSVINPVIPATSDLAKVLGVNGLERETSLNMSGGISSVINDNLSFTADVFRVSVDNRIMLSGGIPTAGFPQFVAAGFPQQTTVFVNAIDTRTSGVELTLNYKYAINQDTRLTLNAAFATMATSLVANRKTSTGITVADSVATTFFTKGLPANKLITTAMFDYKKLGVWLRVAHFGENIDPTAMLKVAPTDPTAAKYQVFGAKTLLDLGVNYLILKGLNVQIGVNNLFDVYPDLLQVPQTANEVIFSRRTNQFGTQGRFFNLTLNYTF